MEAIVLMTLVGIAGFCVGGLWGIRRRESLRTLLLQPEREENLRSLLIKLERDFAGTQHRQPRTIEEIEAEDKAGRGI